MAMKLIPAELTPILQNTYWRERDAALILGAWSESGLTLSAFARQCGLCVTRLRRWKARFKAADGPCFHPVQLIDVNKAFPAEAAALEENGIEVLVGSGRRLVVRRGFDRLLLLELVEALESC